METYTVMVWNVEIYGDFRFEHQDNAVSSFIAILMHDLKVDVLVIQELRKAGSYELFILTKYLKSHVDKNWQYDWIKGAIKDDVQPGVNLRANDLAFTQTANHEGYGVIFCNGALTPFPKPGMSGKGHVGADPYISLITQGAELSIDTTQRPPLFPGVHKTDQTLLLPIPNPNPVKDPDPQRQLDPTGIAGTLSYDRVRRPCCICLQTGQTNVDLVVYHAPVSGFGPYYGTSMCGLVNQVQKGAPVIVAGDFNMTEDRHLNSGFKNFTDAGMQYGTGDPNTGFQRSMLRYTVNNQGQALIPGNAQNQEFYGNPRDQLLYRLNSPNLVFKMSEVVDLPKKLMVDQNFAQRILSDLAIRKCVHHSFGNHLFPDLVKNDQPLYDKLINIGLGKAQDFSNQQIATVFLKLFISDHLPLLIEFEYQ